MLSPSEITPVILTFNEEPNIARTLAPLAWADRIVVVDSFSTDQTVAICQQHPKVTLLQRRFDDHTSQWNYALDQVTSAWVLSLDADYVMPPEFVSELPGLAVDGVEGFSARFRYCVFGRRLRGSLYPPRVVLFRRDTCRYVEDGHTQRLKVNGKTGWLGNAIDHDDRKPIDRWFFEQVRYSAHEARHLAATPESALNRNDRLRKRIVLAPPLVFLYALIVQGLVLDAWPGWYYALQRTLAEVMLSLRLLDGRLRK
jgi:glycosyltransferase involved in cell wall biosynthesis